MQMLFEIVDHIPAPVLPVDRNNRHRTADGDKCFDVDQATAATGIPPASLKRLWLTVWADAVPAPDASALPSAVRSEQVEGLQRRALRCIDFAHLSDDDYTYVDDFCQHHGLSLWSRHVYALYEWDDAAGSNLARVRLSIDGMRAIAMQTGEHAGFKAAEFEMGSHPRFPVKASVIAYRRIEGKKVAFDGIAYWDDYRPDAVEDSFWERMPHVMLEKVAEAIALRRAYPMQLANLYTIEETDRMRRRPALRRPGRPSAAPPHARDVEPDELTPMQFGLRLIDFGFQDQGKRNNLLAVMHAKFGRMAETDPQRFYRAVLDCLSREPHAYGAQESGAG